jgi:hypothetical protein
MRFNQNHNTTNQNVQNQQNQLQQRSESIYGVRGIANVNRRETGGVYGVGHGNPAAVANSAAAAGSTVAKFSSGPNRPESMYGMVVNHRQDSVDSSYSSYHSSANSGGGRPGNAANFAAGNKCGGGVPPQGFSSTRNDMRQSAQTSQHQVLSPAPASVINTANSVASYHHNQRLSPNPQY